MAKFNVKVDAPQREIYMFCCPQVKGGIFNSSCLSIYRVDEVQKFHIHIHIHDRLVNILSVHQYLEPAICFSFHEEDSSLDARNLAPTYLSVKKKSNLPSFSNSSLYSDKILGMVLYSSAMAKDCPGQLRAP